MHGRATLHRLRAIEEDHAATDDDNQPPEPSTSSQEPIPATFWDGVDIHWRRVEYDIEAVRRLIIANESLDDRLGERLLEGR